MPAAIDTDNLVEGNEIVGNANGIFITSGVQGNTFRGNTIVGNPPVQVAVDHTANGGFDIKNLADAGANTFESNICMTSINAPCPAVGVSLTADPNPIPVAGNAVAGATTLSWNASGADTIEIHIGSPNGTLFVQAGNRGSAQAGPWVTDGMTFYLQDVTGGKPLTADYTLATLTVHLQRSSAAGSGLPDNSGPWTLGAPAILLALAWPRGRRLRTALSSAVLLAGIACAPARAQQTPAKLDQVIARGSSKELAHYIFDTHGCKTCHTIGHDGKLGFTENGKERAKGFEGCINMLTAMTVIVQVPQDKRSPPQRQKAQRFEEFGCTACHKLTPGKLSLTDVGAKLAHLHVGCVEVEKLVSSRSEPAQN
jgi:parallel beta-helix repeat protein